MEPSCRLPRTCLAPGEVAAWNRSPPGEGGLEARLASSETGRVQVVPAPHAANESSAAPVTAAGGALGLAPLLGFDGVRGARGGRRRSARPLALPGLRQRLERGAMLIGVVLPLVMQSAHSWGVIAAPS